MARLTKQERATLDELSKRAKAEDDDDASYSITVETANGHKVKLTGADARKYARKHGLELDDDDQDPDDEENVEDVLEDEADARDDEPAAKRTKKTTPLPPDPAPGGDDGYFRRRAR